VIRRGRISIFQKNLEIFNPRRIMDSLALLLLDLNIPKA
jgi:hypothetical protein